MSQLGKGQEAKLMWPCSYDSAVVGGAVDLPMLRSQFGLDKMSPKQLEFVSSNIESTYQAGQYLMLNLHIYFV